MPDITLCVANEKCHKSGYCLRAVGAWPEEKLSVNQSFAKFFREDKDQWECGHYLDLHRDHYLWKEMRKLEDR